MLKVVVELAAYGVAATLAMVCILAWAWKWSGWYWTAVSRQLRRSALTVMVAMAVVATMKAQKGDRGAGAAPPAPAQQTGTTGILPVGDTGTTGDPPVEDITDTFHFSAIAVSTSGTVALTTAWTNGFLTAGQTIDILVKTDLRDAAWTWLTNGVVEAGATSMSWTIANQSPSNSFYKAVVRDTFTDMDDPDGDGLPNAYELAHGRNPWVQDYALVQKLTVGPNGEFGDIVSALAASEEYSVIELAPGEYELSSRVVMPPYPVMVTATEPYAIIRSTANIGVFEINASQTEETLFRNIYLWLGAKSGYQAGFWCGGVLPWDGFSSSATFQNVYVRMPHPGVEYFGWHFYRASMNRVVMQGCVVNAAGATWANGVYAYDPPPLEISGCTFVNFPTNKMSAKSCGFYLETSSANHGGVSNCVAIGISDTLFDGSFTNALPLARFEYGSNFCVSARNVLLPAPFADGHAPDVTNGLRLSVADVAWTGHPLIGSSAWSWGVGALPPIIDSELDFDNDGLYDGEEAYSLGTDPWLADTDGDGSPDGEEDDYGTDPRDSDSHIVWLAVTVTNRVCCAGVTNYVFEGDVGGWQENEVFRCMDDGGTTNVDRFASSGLISLGAFMDLNRNGTYDPDEDILLTKHVQTSSAIATFRFEFGDVDGDGCDDIAERGAGTDPYSQLSLVVRREIQINNPDWRNNVTNHLWISTSSLTNDAILHVCATNTISTNICDVATNGVLYAIIMRDLNKNGIYDEGVDVWMIRTFANGGSVFSVKIGDADGDGVFDSVERVHGTDPFDSRNFRFNTSAFFECMDQVPGLTNYVQVAIDDDGWNDTLGQAFIGCVSGKFPVSGITTSGGFYAKYFRDVNCNGVYDEGVDIFAARRFGYADNSTSGSGVLIGDCDSDGVPDSEELAAGTDPVNSLDYRFNLDLTVGGVFATSNNLTAVVLVDGVAATTPCIVTGRSFACSLTNLYPHTGSGVVVRFWDDVNQNGIRDAGEKTADQSIVADGTNTVVYCRLPMGQFDADNDGMPDYWEVQNGLSPQNPTDALEDPDGDGLINLHEYMAGCNVWVSDGIDTALYAFCHAIDDRIWGLGKLPVEIFPEDQLGWMAQFGTERNENCWAYGIDISSASPWNSLEMGLRAGTAISRRHILFAHHYQIAPGKEIKFIGSDNSTIILTNLTNKSLAGTDITIGLLSGDLPESVMPVSILPSDYRRFIGDARRLPMLFIDNEENANISDSNALPYRGMDSDGLVPVAEYRQMYFEQVIDGDSGGPKYFVCDNVAILACALRTYGTGASGRGPFTTYYRKRIQSVMDELCPGYTLREFDLSTFRRLDDED